MAEPQQQQIQLRIDESRMHTTYANTIRTTSTQDEVVMDFGLNLPFQSPDNKPAMIFNVGSRIVTNWMGAKRLAMSLSQLIQQYESQMGEIKLDRGTPPAGGQR